MAAKINDLNENLASQYSASIQPQPRPSKATAQGSGQGQPQGHPKHWAQMVTSKRSPFLRAGITPDLPHLSLNYTVGAAREASAQSQTIGTESQYSTPASLRHQRPNPSPSGSSKWIQQQIYYSERTWS